MKKLSNIFGNEECWENGGHVVYKLQGRYIFRLRCLPCILLRTCSTMVYPKSTKAITMKEVEEN